MTAMHWMVELRNCVLDADSDRHASRILGGTHSPGAALLDRAKFLRECWKHRPESIEELTATACQHAAKMAAAGMEIAVADVSAALLAITNGTSVPDSVRLDDKQQHHKLIYLGLRHLESITHHNPWREATSRSGRVLSNMTPAAFTFDDVHFASTESFLQSMRLPPKQNAPSRFDVAAMPAVDAQKAGRAAKKRQQVVWGMDDPVWLWGLEERDPIERRSPEFDIVMTQALIARMRSNLFVAKAVAACGHLPTVHYVRRRGRYRINGDSHLPRCFPAVRTALAAEPIMLTAEEQGHWLKPSHPDSHAS